MLCRLHTYICNYIIRLDTQFTLAQKREVGGFGAMRCIRCVWFLLAAWGAAQAQFDSGQISGFVRDPSSAVVASAKVTITNEGNGQKHRVVSNSNGYYVVPNLFVATYSVEVEAPGFKKF